VVAAAVQAPDLVKAAAPAQVARTPTAVSPPISQAAAEAPARLAVALAAERAAEPAAIQAPALAARSITKSTKRATRPPRPRRAAIRARPAPRSSNLQAEKSRPCACSSLRYFFFLFPPKRPLRSPPTGFAAGLCPAAGASCPASADPTSGTNTGFAVVPVT
jgi:hypothetical protein